MRPYKEDPYEFTSKWFRPAYLKGIEEGRDAGKAEGLLDGEREALKRLLRHLRALTATAESRIDAADRGELEGWLDELADGKVPAELGESG